MTMSKLLRVNSFDHSKLRRRDAAITYTEADRFGSLLFSLLVLALQEHQKSSNILRQTLGAK